jgi:hypothetical protein
LVKIQNTSVSELSAGLQGMYYSTGRYLLHVVNLRVELPIQSFQERIQESDQFLAQICMHFLIADMGCMISGQQPQYI